MRRREFITLLGGAAAAWPLAARAQQTERMRRVGVLLPFDNENDGPVPQLWSAFKQRLRELGWVEGRNIRFDLHFTTQNIIRLRAGAAELVASSPEVIVVWSNPGLASMREATQTVPVVFALVGDPVGNGFVASLARPGGNVMASVFNLQSPEMARATERNRPRVAPRGRRLQSEHPCQH
jgi:putative ABC transport system substrate-binding protein